MKMSTLPYPLDTLTPTPPLETLPPPTPHKGHGTKNTLPLPQEGPRINASENITFPQHHLAVSNISGSATLLKHIYYFAEE